MKKKLNVLSGLLLLVSTVIFIIFNIYMRGIKDNVPPVITFQQEELVVSVEATEEELLNGVKAEDKRAGDVTDSVVLESLSAFTEDGKRIATYAAVDNSMNVGRGTRTIVYSDYERPQFEMYSSLCFPMGTAIDLISPVGASSGLDGNLTYNVKYSLGETINTTTEGEYPIEYRVTDSSGNTVYLDLEVEICDKSYSGITVDLKEYLIYAKKGQTIDYSEYYKGASREGSLDIKANVNTKEAGTYYVDYIVSDGTSKGKSRLVVIVQ